MVNHVVASEFMARRDTLVQKLKPNSIALVSTNAVSYRNSDVEYPYRADSYFHYLTGFNEPEAIVLIETFEANQPDHYTLFCRERNHDEEIWNGYRTGLQGAVQQYLADQAEPIDSFDALCSERLLDKSHVYICLGHDDIFEQRILDILEEMDSETAITPLPLNPILDEMRLFKSTFEIERIKKATDITAKAHTNAMQAAYGGVMEYELAAELHYQFNKHGCEPAYGTIVAGGENACVLHYVENNQPIENGQLVLIDAGCEYQYYASDVTRTFPVSGIFSAEQRALYQLVLDAEIAAIDAVKVGSSFIEPHNVAVKILTQGLLDLGLLQGELTELLETQAYNKFYMHGTSHWLGLDVHDVGQYKINEEYRNFESGMVLTIEPGLYIAKDEQSVAEKWRGIGIRIEDNVLVTDQGPEVLTASIVKEVEQIEALMQGKNKNT
ncbi:aminopeptidase P N-terminal domain-containing protein [Acinetobacter rathckeae]|uniref:aminopeptidase P N-terminal domain-containing protein n=1 Tax=Acinetobacter rathckeae TaxID=2605272 RepID=UPI0018A2A346|nr:aminopeptidase P N-terminal domain-containing protein [Acinetobacter rathckeae]MBF7686743.1 aminopeptidase P N-terminal domain-containing protein [Acinetobacter rathckeae]MBF7695725.1 aminopeptidase P N-terminal domain-containing protein [Acinetobacter rathckeae]